MGDKIWRSVSSDFIDIGRALEEIEQHMRNIRATSVVEEHFAIHSLNGALAASRRLTKALYSLRSIVTDQDASE